MIELIKQIDDLVYNVKNDSNRSKLIDLWVLLLELSKHYWEAKKEYVRAKNELEREEVMKKEVREQRLTKQEDDRYTKELETDPKKAKKNKVTDAEITRVANLELIGLKDKVAEAKMLMDYLEPIISWYYEILNLIKFFDRQNTKTTFNWQQ